MKPLIEKAVDEFENGNISRRELVHKLCAIGAFASLGLNRFSSADEPAATFKATGIDHVALTVTDIARSRAYYEKHLGMRATYCGEQSCFLDCGSDFLALFKGPTPGLNHLSFSIPNYDPAVAVKSLKAAGLEPDREADRVYFDDPDGLVLQVSPE